MRSFFKIVFLGFLVTFPLFLCPIGEHSVVRAAKEVESLNQSLNSLEEYSPVSKFDHGVDPLTLVCLREAIEELNRSIVLCDFSSDQDAELLLRIRSTMVDVCDILKTKFSFYSSQNAPSKDVASYISIVGMDYELPRLFKITYYSEPIIIDLANAIDKFFQSIYWDPAFRKDFNKRALGNFKRKLFIVQKRASPVVACACADASGCVVS